MILVRVSESYERHFTFLLFDTILLFLKFNSGHEPDRNAIHFPMAFHQDVWVITWKNTSILREINKHLMISPCKYFNGLNDRDVFPYVIQWYGFKSHLSDWGNYIWAGSCFFLFLFVIQYDMTSFSFNQLITSGQTCLWRH